MRNHGPEGRHRLLVAVCVALFIGLPLAGCLASTHGTVAVYVKAEPTDEFTEVEVTVTRVEIQRSGSNIGDGQDPTVPGGAGEDAEDPRRGITELSGDTKTVDLLEFQEPESRALVGTERAPEGTYGTLILRFEDEARGVREDGSEVTIGLRSTQIQPSHEFDVEVDETIRIIIEFDLDESITQNDAGEYRMTLRVADVREEPRAGGGEGDQPDRGV